MKPFFLLGIAVLGICSHGEQTDSRAMNRTLDSLKSSFFIQECCSTFLAPCLAKQPPCDLATRLLAFAEWLIPAVGSYSKAELELQRRYASLTTNDMHVIDTTIMPWLGDAKAATTIVIYVSANCGICKKVTTGLIEEVTEGRLKKTARLMIKPFGAGIGDLALIAATRKGKLWEFFDLIRLVETRLDEETILGAAEKSGINRNEFAAVLTDSSTRALLAACRSEGKNNGVEVTPTIFINGRRYRSYKDPRWVVDAAEFIGGKHPK
mgnify:CR=1 FL=1